MTITVLKNDQTDMLNVNFTTIDKKMTEKLLETFKK